MTVRDTSIEAYFGNVKPHLGEKQQVVHRIIQKLGNATNEEIAKELQAPINRITPRTFELRKMGLVIEAGKRQCAVTGSNSHSWKINNGSLFG